MTSKTPSNPPSGDLEKRLREILQTPHRDSTGSLVMTFPTKKTFVQIEQAFKDAGYIHRGKSSLNGWEYISHKKLSTMMTGAEWYARFVKEIYDMNPKDTPSDVWMRMDILEAAKRVAGIE